ncbi:MAG: PAS domain S-box protein [Xanthomonadales bacterium]|nr:PAS domain S-box protein [Xanthomonadales bacterium]
MRNNQPVTGKEVLLEDGQTIVSRTDLKGAISYVNRDFLLISGFTEAELIGQPHNLIRHPDMPEAAFADMWSTLKAGRPWVGMVKNRCKSGDHYWVEAHATPVFEQGKAVGYLSVRRKASREQIALAERQYAAIRAGRAMGLVVRRGAVKRLGMNARYNPLWRMSLRQRLLLSAGGVSVFALCMMWVSGAETAVGMRWSIFVFGALAAFYSAWWLAHDIGSRLRDAERQFRAIGGGDYRQTIAIDRNDEVGAVLLGLKSMQIRLGFEVQEHKRIAESSLRIKQALDVAATNVMVTDHDLNVVYANPAIQHMLKHAESDLRKEMPHFDADHVLGKNIDHFHRHPEHQRKLLATLDRTHKTVLHVGGRTIDLVVNPVLDEAHERIGLVTEWRDRTDDVAVERMVSELVQAAGRGDFSARVDTVGKNQFVVTLGNGLNALLDTTERSLGAVTAVLSALAAGDLTKRIDTELQGRFGEIKDATNTTVEQLSGMMGVIKRAVDSIHVAAREISAGNTDLANRTEQQAAELEETASSMEELTATVQHNTEHAGEANQLAQSAAVVVQKGESLVQQVVATMGEIDASSRRIEDIIGVIDGIAFQTNILALNAAVEAARAGEQGRGFAVVASEVRSLAQRSATAAREIKHLIAESVERAHRGAEVVDETGRTMAGILSSVDRVSSIMGDISAATREQAAGIVQVNSTVMHLDQATQQNAALVEEASAAARSLEEQATALASEVARFRL